MSDDTTAEPGGLSRRDMLRRSALVGGTIVWVTPAVQSIASPAFANGSPVEERPCLFTFFLKFDPEAGAGCINGFCPSESPTHLPSCDPGPSSESTPILADDGLGGVTITVDGTPLGNASASYNPSGGGCVTITFTGFTVSETSSYFIVKDGGGPGCEAADGGDFGDVPSAGSSFTFCGETTPQEGLSHLNMAVCVTANT